MKQSTDDTRGYSRVAACKGNFGCRKKTPHFHVENFSSVSARSPFSTSGPFTCVDNADDEIKGDLCATREQQMDVVLQAMDQGILPLQEELDDALDRILDPIHTLAVAGELALLGKDDLLDDEDLPEITIKTDETDEDARMVVVTMGDSEEDLPIAIAAEAPPPARRRSAQPPIIASGEIGYET